MNETTFETKIVASSGSSVSQRHEDKLSEQSQGWQSNGSTRDDINLWQALKKWHRTVFYCLGLSFGILLYGYDFVIVGSSSSMPSFQVDFGQKWGERYIIPSLWLGLWNFASPGGSMFGALIGGYAQDRIGRRFSLAIGSFLSAVGVAILFVSNQPNLIHTRRIVFLVGKLFQGGAVGMVLTTAHTHMSEILPPVLRGPIITFIPSFTLLGQFFGALVIYACLKISNGYLICYATQWIFSIIPLVVAFIVPESPTYLIRKGKHELASKAQMKLNAPGMDAEEILDTIRKNIEHERQQTESTYIDCFNSSNRRRTLIVLFSNLLPQFFGLTLLAKASYFVQTVGMPANPSLMILIVGISGGVLANFASIYIISRFPRRSLILTTLSLLAILWASMGVAGCWPGKPSMWYISAMIIAVVIVAGLGVWPCSQAVATETSSLELRAKTLGLGWLVNGGSAALFGFFLPYIFNTDQGNLGGKTGFVYTGFCLIALIVSYFHVPEMKGRTSAEIDMMFDLKLDARLFASWSPSIN